MNINSIQEMIGSIQEMIGSDPLMHLIIGGVIVALLVAIVGIISARSHRRKAANAPQMASNDNVKAAQPARPTAQPVAQPAAQAAPVTPPPAPAVRAVSSGTEQLGVGRAWSAMPGGWQALRSMNANIDLPVHGLFPIDDGIARTEAGNMIAAGPGGSWTAMPGGWAALAAGTLPTAAPAASAAPVAPVASQPEPAPVFAAAAAAAATVASATGNGAAAGSGTAATASWASMPGGWQALQASGVATGIANHGNYPLVDGIARTEAGSIIP